ncbi:LEAF RUST 10 DISEASE-RESISTANCE LOCUS RECEPTOR-LIKE PROTEIN KINASE-like 2.1 isoform X2 [Humulus lupulus]|uniref:LEAF RUST 10 DISEASE-RESISTANCE LOCUS RECEPTOR-LIKE PROTEIN KINASE-like 2.1 isoform X2 n=1 Tax=Humulus lupulus TaxID=3486 RepID=UPI002B4053BB|nr:LEAF RUST 10 DISEASE-RESISTANCE LOCUS RECEPTOR-LIKE PROTEIN KINASE-like 2.1 isoform X2 [Humulus lupulus]
MHQITLSPITLAKLLLLLFFFFLFSGESTATGDSLPDSCNNTTFNCGHLRNISHPFSGGNRPDHCGLPQFRLTCVNDSTELTINSVKYRVLRLNSSEQTLSLARSDLWNKTCTREFVNTTFEDTAFSSGADNVDLRLAYECRNVEADKKPLNMQFECEDHAPAFFLVGPVEFDLLLGNITCDEVVRVPMMESSGKALLSNPSSLAEALMMGFNVNYTIPMPPGIVVATVSIIILFTMILCYHKREQWVLNWIKEKKEELDVEASIRNHGSIAPKRYSYATIKKMTNSFTQEIGKGGFGVVFKGTLPDDGRLVAVKMLNSSKSNGEDFINEVVTIGRTSHVNIVTLIGFCYERKKRALVYEYMPNGSLDNFIFNKEASGEENNRLERKTLYQIAIGIAKGLEYLHCGCNTRILHFDIKPQNILLDEDFCPKISDFGLAKLSMKKHESIVSMVGARGTIGYIAPEVITRGYGGVSHKSDVYSFGMLVLEMVGGRNNYDVAASRTSEIYYPNIMYKDLEIENNEASIMRNMTELEKEMAKKMILASFWCIQTNPADRPSMSKVVEMLEGSLQSIEIPPKPSIMFSPSRSP